MSERRIAKTMGFTELKTWLRHKHPMVLLDRVTDYEPGSFLSARVSATGALDVFAGHFPERAIYPGSHLLQAFSQAGIILLQLSSSRLREDELTLVGSVEARFFKIVVPGDILELRLELDRVIENSYHFAGKFVVEGTRMAAFRASLVRVPVASLGSPLW